MGRREKDGKPRSTKAYLLATAFVAFMLLAFTPPYITSLIDQHRSASWPTVSDHVTTSELRWARLRLSNTRVHDIEYIYESNSELHTATHHSLVTISIAHWIDRAIARYKRYPMSSQVEVAVNPADPSVATIRTGLKIWDFAGAIFLGSLLLGLLRGCKELAFRFMNFINDVT